MLSGSGAGAVTSGAGLTGCSGPGSSIIVFPSGAGGVSVGFSVGENSTAMSFSVFSATLGYSAVVVSAGAVFAARVVSGSAFVVSSVSGSVSEDASTHSCETVEGGGSSAVNGLFLSLFTVQQIPRMATQHTDSMVMRKPLDLKIFFIYCPPLILFSYTLRDIHGFFNKINIKILCCDIRSIQFAA